MYSKISGVKRPHWTASLRAHTYPSDHIVRIARSLWVVKWQTIYSACRNWRIFCFRNWISTSTLCFTLMKLGYVIIFHVKIIKLLLSVCLKFRKGTPATSITFCHHYGISQITSNALSIIQFKQYTYRKIIIYMSVLIMLSEKYVRSLVHGSNIDVCKNTKMLI